MVYVTSCENVLYICGAFNPVSYYFFLFFVFSFKALQRVITYKVDLEGIWSEKGIPFVSHTFYM